jgi:hypothetical protein
MQSLSDVLKNFNPVHDKYISREFQTYAIYLAESLQDEKHKSLYMKLAKTVPRAILERALSFVIDSNADSKAKLFMWKLKELRSLNPMVETQTGPAREKVKQQKVKRKVHTRDLPLFS